MTIDAPRDDLFRGLTDRPEMRADGGADTGSLMYGHFAVFDTWTEIHSWFEGDFMERLAVGAFKKTMRDQRDSVKVQYDHGYDLAAGEAQLGPIDELREDDEGAYYEVPLLDRPWVRDELVPMLEGRLINGEKRGSLLGASFRFRVTRDEWNNEPKKSDTNPDGLPERTIREVRLYEFGPVNFPAYAEATAKVRSLTDHYQERRLARLGTAERAATRLAPSLAVPPPGTPSPTPVAPPQAPDVTGAGLTLARAITDIERLKRRAS